jgi:hypothetical protein
VAHNKAYGHIEAVRGKPKVDEDGKVKLSFVDNSVKLFFKHWILHNLTIQFNAL